ncbi:hypothetical protein [Photobacterium kishitanii]|uniref:hypothetical protein n=1 Tax=Photobacterium kishitanii TaxID=318456 RepID=UPI00071AECC7|nr:hypothetical protein [Photobacterium kishitanii]
MSLGGFFLALISSSLVALLSVQFALRKFKLEKRWEKKLDCYSDIMDSLGRVIIYVDMALDVNDGVNHDDVAFKAQKIKFNEAIVKMQFHEYSSAILLDDSSHAAVTEFSNKLFRVETSCTDQQKLGKLREDATSCLSVISSNGKRVLIDQDSLINIFSIN